MSDIESDRSADGPTGSDQWTSARPDPVDPAGNLYDTPAMPSPAPDVDIDSGPVSDRPTEMSAINDTAYTTIEGEPTAPDVARRTGTHEVQGKNELGYEGTCGLASMSEMLQDQFGETVTENDVVVYASDASLCATPDSGVGPDLQGGTTLDRRDLLLKEYDGLEVDKVKGANLQELADRIEADDGVLAAVKAGEYSPDEASFRPAQAEQGPDHVVWVTGVERDSSGELKGFIVNDTGRVDGAGLHLDVDHMTRAWENHGGMLNIARRSAR